MFSLICTRINGWVNNREAGDLRRHRAYHDVIVTDCCGSERIPIKMWHTKRNIPISQIPQCIRQISHIIFVTGFAQMNTFLLQNGAFWNIGLWNTGIVNLAHCIPNAKAHDLYITCGSPIKELAIWYSVICSGNQCCDMHIINYAGFTNEVRLKSFIELIATQNLDYHVNN